MSLHRFHNECSAGFAVCEGALMDPSMNPSLFFALREIFMEWLHVP